MLMATMSKHQIEDRTTFATMRGTLRTLKDELLQYHDGSEWLVVGSGCTDLTRMGASNGLYVRF